jgi:carbamoyl-phosphate synthase large subunit
LKKACEELGYPKNKVVIKSALGNGSRGIRILEEGKDRFNDFFEKKPSSMSSTLNEIIEIFKDKPLPEMFVMEYLPGKEYSVDVWAENGEIKYIVGRLCSLVVNSITMECELLKDSNAYKICEEIIKELNITGNIGFDFKANEKDEQVLMEINPRLTATVALNEKGGVNFPYLGIKQILNEELPNITVDYNVKLRRRYNEVYFDKFGNEMR